MPVKLCERINKGKERKGDVCMTAANCLHVLRRKSPLAERKKATKFPQLFLPVCPVEDLLLTPKLATSLRLGASPPHPEAFSG